MSAVLKLYSLVSNLSWNDAQNEELPSEFTSEPVHIALEKADQCHKWDIFQKIMDKDSHNKIVLLHHIKNTTFYWNCKYQSFWREHYKDLYDGCLKFGDEQPVFERRCESCQGKLVASEDREPDCILCYKVVCDDCANIIPQRSFSFVCPDCRKTLSEIEWKELHTNLDD